MGTSAIDAEREQDIVPPRCENCDTALHGDYCHHCGQSIVNPIRHAGHELEDGPGAAVTYEVNLDLDVGIADAYRAWLATHVAEICALPGFIGARVFAVQDPVPGDGRSSLCVQYTLRDQAALEAYLHEHAPRLRAEGIQRFGDRFRASRRVLREIAMPAARTPDP